MGWFLPRISGFGFLLLLATAHSGAGDAKKETPAPNYYPLDLGNEWQFRVTANGKNSTVTTRVGRIENVNGVKFARLESPNVNITEHLSSTDKGIFRNRLNGAAVTPAFRLLPYPVTPGAKWEGEFSIDKDLGTHKYSGELHQEEAIETPAGKFKALRAVIKLQRNGKVVETSYWFVKDVGFVKQTFEAGGVSVLYELEKFDKKK